MHKNINTLVDQIRAGDIRAYAVVVGRFQNMALTYAYSILGDYQQAEDAVQEAFITSSGSSNGVHKKRTAPTVDMGV